MNIAEIIKPEDVVVDLSVPTKAKLIQFLAEKASERLGIGEEVVYAALKNREQLGSTGIGDGVAIPHANISGISEPFALIVRLKKAVNFDSIDDVPVDIVFVVLTPAEKASAHLNVLSCIARKTRSQALLTAVRSALSQEAVYAVLTGEDQ